MMLLIFAYCRQKWLWTKETVENVHHTQPAYLYLPYHLEKQMEAHYHNVADTYEEYIVTTTQQHLKMSNVPA